MKPYLALFRAGPKSLHPHTVENIGAQEFDYALSYFGDDVPPADGAVFVHHQKGPKWPGLSRTLAAHWDTIQQYEYVWFPDDDLLCPPDQVSRMFSICKQFKLDLAQPALTHDSYFTHVATLQHKQFSVRFANFVEIMAPVFSVGFLARVSNTFSENLSGYGLDALWPRLSKLGKVAMIDDVAIKHTRPVGGDNYTFNHDAGVPAWMEDWFCSASYFIESPSDHHIMFGGVLQSGNTVAMGGGLQDINSLLRELIASISAAPVSPFQLTRYLSNHLTFWRGSDYGGPRYTRDLIPAVLNRELAHTGLKFSCVGENVPGLGTALRQNTRLPDGFGEFVGP